MFLVVCFLMMWIVHCQDSYNELDFDPRSKKHEDYFDPRSRKHGDYFDLRSRKHGDYFDPRSRKLDYYFDASPKKPEDSNYDLPMDYSSLEGQVPAFRKPKKTPKTTTKKKTTTTKKIAAAAPLAGGGTTRKTPDETYFPSIEGYYVDAAATTEKAYPWIARVVHSSSKDYPHMCTAVCMDDRVFATAARCIYTLKINYTRVFYAGNAFKTIAFVLPSTPSRQSYDDIGFIVVNSKGFRGTWATIEPVAITRNDNGFKWFDTLLKKDKEYRTVGYAVPKTTYRVKNAYTKNDLVALDVVILGRNACSEIFAMNMMKAFYVPCYHSCSLKQFNKRSKSCRKYLGAEGAAIYNTASKKLLGIATWSASFYRYELPVGFSVPNSNNFYKDFKCAKAIRDDKTVVKKDGYYQSLCNQLK